MEQKKEVLEKNISNDTTFLSKMEFIMKKDSKDRKRILNDVAKDLDSHSKKIVEYDRTAKAYRLLELKYASLEKEMRESEQMNAEKVNNLTTKVNNLENENKLLKRIAMNQKRKISGLQSIVELVVNDYGIQNIEIVTGLSSDKIREYFQEEK